MKYLLHSCKYDKGYNKDEYNGSAVVEIYGVVCEVIDTVEQCITPRNNVIHGNKIM